MLLDTPFSKTKSSSAIHNVEKICVGGDNQKKWLVQASPQLDDKIVVSGTLSSDHGYLATDDEKPVQQKVGVSTTFKSLLLSTKTASPQAVLHGVIGEGKLEQNFLAFAVSTL